MKFLLLTTFFFLAIVCISQDINKKPLEHDVYDAWKDLKHPIISNDGGWISFEINPQKGDGWIYLYNVPSHQYDSVSRGNNAVFSPNNNFLVFKIKPQYDTVRSAKLKKVKKEDLPKDTLGILLFEKDSLLKLERVKSFKMPEEESDWLAFHHEKTIIKKDSTNDADTTNKATKPEKKKKGSKKKNDNTNLSIINPITGKTYLYHDVAEYFVSKNGKSIGFITSRKDTIDSTGVYIFNTDEEFLDTIIYQAGYAKNLTINDDGNLAGFILSSDTAKTKIYDLYLRMGNEDIIKIVDRNNRNMPEDWCVSEHASLYFSEDNERFYFGTAKIPEPELKDTLTDDEKVSVDIWNWKDSRLQPHQLKQAKDEKKINYTAVYHIHSGEMIQLGNELIRRIDHDIRGNGNYALGIARKPYWRLMSWEASGYFDAYLIDQETGHTEIILRKAESSINLSPDGKYILWYNAPDSSWHVYNIKKKTKLCLTCDINYAFYNEDNDMPNEPRPYGFAGWTEDDEYVVIYDRFDLWKLDPEGKEEPLNITNNHGRENDIRFHTIWLDRDERYLPGQNLLLSAFNETTKENGYYRIGLKSGNPQKLIMQDFRFGNTKQAKDDDILIWKKENFNEYPELWVSDLNFAEPVKVTSTNPQQNDYNWGSVELLKWTSLDGEELEGLLYKPEDFDPSNKYPMIVYFYETYSNSLHRHYVPKPSRSVINFTYYVSNGYLIFIPDIKYKTGFPGKSAYNAIMSGTMHLAKNPWVDKEHMGLQGQSWGGYQVAYLVTQTDLFAAAEAGAPVSNMTSAYGGIRWGSGLSRMFQYEESQSRIGGTLWDRRDLYIDNSPIFFTPQINTPLLIMHNDEDGAVPWYQGIELFVALRRLNKPVWMLTYNKAPHNLKRRADCEDLTRRMQQFFDHYLKDAPAPKWMVDGIPAVDKGKEFGFELVEE